MWKYTAPKYGSFDEWKGPLFVFDRLLEALLKLAGTLGWWGFATLSIGFGAAIFYINGGMWKAILSGPILAVFAVMAFGFGAAYARIFMALGQVLAFVALSNMLRSPDPKRAIHQTVFMVLSVPGIALGGAVIWGALWILGSLPR